MTTDISLRTDSWTTVLDPARILAEDIAATEFVPAALRGNKHKVLAAVLTGRELGLGPMQSLASIDVIDGKASLNAKTMLALIRQKGHQVRTVEAGNQRYTLKARRSEDRDDPEAWETFTYTAEEARQAGLIGKKNWERYRQDMLLARATTRMARMLFPDVIMGLETSEVMMDGGDMEAQVLTGELVEAVEVAAPPELRTVKTAKQKSSPAGSRQKVGTQPPKPHLTLADIDSSEIVDGGEVEDGATDTPSPLPAPDIDGDTGEILDAEVIEETEDTETLLAEAGAVEIITKPQLSKLHVLLKEVGWGDPISRDEAIQFYHDVTGDDSIESSGWSKGLKGLTKVQAMRVIDALEKMAKAFASGPMTTEGDDHV